jgi:hypothetical protein
MATTTDPGDTARSRASKLAQACFRYDPMHAMQFRAALLLQVRSGSSWSTVHGE